MFRKQSLHSTLNVYKKGSDDEQKSIRIVSESGSFFKIKTWPS